MSSISTAIRLFSYASAGLSLRDKRLMFLLSGFGILGPHRTNMKAQFTRWIERFDENGSIRFHLLRNNLTSTLSLRTGNLADYLIAGEFIRGSYDCPSFTPESIVDAGANIGTFSIHAKSLFPNAILTCFEPDEENFNQLKTNLTSNGIEGICHKKGVWSSSGTFYFHSSESHIGYIDDSPDGIPIACHLPEIGPDCWLKIDAEGSEYEVIPALFAKKSYPRFISMEIHHYRERGEALINLLKEHQYRVMGDLGSTADCIEISAEHANSSVQ